MLLSHGNASVRRLAEVHTLPAKLVTVLAVRVRVGRFGRPPRVKSLSAIRRSPAARRRWRRRPLALPPHRPTTIHALNIFDLVEKFYFSKVPSEYRVGTYGPSGPRPESILLFAPPRLSAFNSDKNSIHET